MVSFVSLIEKDRTTYSDLTDYLKEIRDWQTLATHILPGNYARPIEKSKLPTMEIFENARKYFSLNT